MSVLSFTTLRIDSVEFIVVVSAVASPNIILPEAVSVPVAPAFMFVAVTVSAPNPPVLINPAPSVVCDDPAETPTCSSVPFGFVNIIELPIAVPSGVNLGIYSTVPDPVILFGTSVEKSCQDV